MAFGVVDKVVDNEVVVRVAHRLDDVDLIGQALTQGIGHFTGVTALQALPAELFKICLVLHAVGRFEVRQFRLAEGKREVALLGNFVRVLAGFGHHGEEVVHLIGGFQIELVGLELHPIHIVDGLAGLDAKQNALHFSVLFGDIMGVVRCRHRDAGLPRQADELRQHDLVFFEAVVLQFDVIVALAEQVPIPQRCLLGAVIVPCQNRAGYLARQAGGQADQTIVVLFQQFLIDTRL